MDSTEFLVNQLFKSNNDLGEIVDLICEAELDIDQILNILIGFKEMLDVRLIALYRELEEDNFGGRE